MTMSLSLEIQITPSYAPDMREGGRSGPYVSVVGHGEACKNKLLSIVIE